MMRIRSREILRAALALGCVGLAANATRLHAGDTLSGFYVSTDAGLNLASDLNASEASISLRPGVRGDASAGHAWKIADEFSVGAELETGILYNTLDKATLHGQPVAVGGYLTGVPLLPHAVLRWEFHPYWIAYAGAGAGCNFSFLHASSTGVNYGLNGTQTDFAWQIMTGIRYQIGSSEIGVGYEYFSFRRSGLQTVGNNSVVVSYTFCF